MRRTEPTRSLLQGMPYVNSVSTDIRARFAAMKAEKNRAARRTTTPPLRIATK